VDNFFVNLKIKEKIKKKIKEIKKLEVDT